MVFIKSKLCGSPFGKHKPTRNFFWLTMVLFLLSITLAVHGTLWASVTPQIAAGNVHSIALNSDGTVWAWGENASGQL